jgi:hypothetical protein
MDPKSTQYEVIELPYMVLDGGDVWVFFPEELPPDQWVMLGVAPW